MTLFLDDGDGSLCSGRLVVQPYIFIATKVKIDVQPTRRSCQRTEAEEALGEPLLEAKKLLGDRVSPVKGGLALPDDAPFAFPGAAWIFRSDSR